MYQQVPVPNFIRILWNVGMADVVRDECLFAKCLHVEGGERNGKKKTQHSLEEKSPNQSNGAQHLKWAFPQKLRKWTDIQVEIPLKPETAPTHKVYVRIITSLVLFFFIRIITSWYHSRKYVYCMLECEMITLPPFCRSKFIYILIARNLIFSWKSHAIINLTLQSTKPGLSIFKDHYPVSLSKLKAHLCLWMQWELWPSVEARAAPSRLRVPSREERTRPWDGVLTKLVLREDLVLQEDIFDCLTGESALI